MREIKFRGYDTDDKVWRYGFYMQKDDSILCLATEKQIKENEHHLILFGGFCDWNMPKPYYQSEVDGNSIGQYTGKHDKNGKEIYEGDIVKFDIYNYEKLVSSTISEIKWCDDLCSLSVVVNKQGTRGTIGHFNNLNTEVEVIGNVYENSDLLER